MRQLDGQDYASRIPYMSWGNEHQHGVVRFLGVWMLDPNRLHKGSLGKFFYPDSRSR